MKRKTVVITGGGRGIGAATAKLFAANHFSVCINYLANSITANALVAEISEQGSECLAVKADVATEQGVASLFDAVDQQFGQLDVLINNVGILKPQCKLVDMDAQRINTRLTQNVTSHFLCSREAIKRMSTSRGGNGGAIVNVGSLASRTGSANEYIDYAASKGAIDTLTIGLSREVAAQGIRVNCVRPGLIYTEMHADGGEPARVDRLKSIIPMGRGGSADEVAESIYWLANDASSFCTGTFLDVSGGM